VSTLESGVAYLFAIIGFVLALNIYFIFARLRKGSNRKKISRVAVDEAKQALWRDKEVQRRIDREDEDAFERVKLRNETLALYDEVRRRHAKDDELESLGLDSTDVASELASLEIEPDSSEEATKTESMYEHVGWGSFYLSDEKDKETAETEEEELDPFDIFKKKK